MRSPLLESPSLVYQPSPYELYGGTHRVRAGDGELLMTWARPAPWFTPWGGATSSWSCGSQAGGDLGAGTISWAWDAGRRMFPSELRSWAIYVADQAGPATGALVVVVLSQRAGWSVWPLAASREWQEQSNKQDPVLYAAIVDRAAARVLRETRSSTTGQPRLASFISPVASQVRLRYAAAGTAI